jgi:linear primary-alkylsulfatase
MTITIDRSDVEQAMIGSVPLEQQIAAGTAVLDGDPRFWRTWPGMLVHFDLAFEILSSTGGTRAPTALDAFAHEPLADSAGG